MPRYAAFLRGMNLGGRRITNTDLCAHVAALGFEDVASFRASGNVIVTSAGRASAARVARRIEEGLAEALGYDVPTYVRSAAQMRAIAAHAPFGDEDLARSKGKVQIALLQRPPSAQAAKAALALDSPDDRLAIHDQELYWLPIGGLSDSELDLKAIAAALGPSTVRTLGTIEQITAKFFS